MRKSISFLLSLCFAFNGLFTVSIANAAETGITVRLDGTDGKMNVSLSMENNCIGKDIMLYVLNPGMSFSDIANNDESSFRKTVQYAEQFKYPKNDISFMMNTAEVNQQIEQKYTIYAVAADSGISVNNTFTYYDKVHKQQMLERVSGEAASTALGDDIIRYFTMQYLELYPKLSDPAAAVARLQAWAKNDLTLSVETMEESFQKAIICEAARQRKITVEELKQYQNIIGLDEGLFAEYESLNDNGLQYILNSIQNCECSNFKEFQDDLRKAIIAALVFGSKTEGYGNVNTVIEKYRDDLIASGMKAAVYDKCDQEKLAKKIISAGYMELASLASYINTNAEQGNDSSSSSSSDSSGSTKSSYVSQQNISKTETAVSFQDLENVPWAAESINALYRGGIISGRQVGIYAPNEKITREEFIKIIVSAFQIPMGTGNVIFSDVSDNDWSHDYIMKAASCGIVSGYGDHFAPKQNITREEMSVVIVNTLKYCSR